MAQALRARERLNQYRERNRRVGLKRIEVLVPEDKADLVKAYAVQLREGAQSARMKKVRELIAKAYKQYYARCLDNISVDPERADFGDAAIVAAALMHRGNADAYKLGRQIRSLAK